MSIVGITGASGFIGRALIEALGPRGHRAIPLGRHPKPEALEGVDVVVHLAGESVAGRWTAAKKDAILRSRVEGTSQLVASLRRCARPPQVLVAASAVGYYGSRGDEPLEETAAPGNDFLAGVCVRWEAAAAQAQTFGIRTAMLRFGVVLGNGGALQQMKPPFLAGLGGPLGSGKQYFPWIHIADVAALCCFAIENAQISGPVNAVAPDEATNARFARALGAALHRPAVLPAPAFALRMLLGEFAETLLASQRVVPAVARAAGFRWEHPQLEAALKDIVR